MIDTKNLLKLYNYFDSIIITDHAGVIEYYLNNRTDIFDLRTNNIVGKTILEIHPYLTEDTSSIMRVLKEGKPIYDQVEHLTTKHGQEMTNIYSTIPIMDKGEIIGAIDLARCIDENARQNIVLSVNDRDQKIGFFNIDDIITESDSMKEVKSKIIKVSNTDSSVMIYGETGTGKELVAQALHTYSHRRDEKFISQNCAAIPHSLLESILFGSVRGSFTGAENRRGLFEVANGGTLLLDEINSMDLSMQAKILKAIEEKKITRIGGTIPIDTDVRIITALNEPPLVCLENNLIREDLFYRLNVVSIDIPPLRERGKDISYLTEYFISMFNQKMNRSVEGISDEVREVFMHYDWPGNVRELKNVIEGAFNIISSKYIQPKDLPSYIKERVSEKIVNFDSIQEDISFNEKIKQYERYLLEKALNTTDSYANAARKLKISKQSFNYKLQKHNLK